MNSSDTNKPAVPAFRRVLVTGGAGFIGHRVVTRLMRSGAHVTVLDNLSVKMPLPPAGPDLTPIEGDIRDLELLRRVCKEARPEAIVHLAAVHHIPTCEKERSYSLDVNIIGTETLLRAAEEHSVRAFVLASSGAVYAWEDNALAEDSSPLEARDNYSLAKLTNERQLAFWAARTGAWARIARIFNTIGHDDPNAHLIPDVVRQLSGGSHVTIRLGNTQTRRDYIHADDTAAGIVAVLGDSRPEPGIDVFNLCSGREHTVADLVREIGRQRGIGIEIEVDPSRIRKIDRASQLGATAKAAGILGWSAQIPFERAVRATVVTDATLARVAA